MRTFCHALLATAFAVMSAAPARAQIDFSGEWAPPYHEDGLIDALAESLVDVWERLGLERKPRALAAE